MIFEQPVNAIGGAAFFVGGEREDEIAIGLVILLLQANEGGGEKCVAIFYVARAAAVVVAVFFDELEGVHGPVFAARFDHIEMADEENRFLRAGAANARDQVAFARIRAEDVNVVGGKTGVEKALGHGVGGNRRTADRIGGIDFDQLLENVV